MTQLQVPNIVPPNEQSKFESVPGYEWANRLTNFVKALAGQTGGGGTANVSITGAAPINTTPSPITGTGVVGHNASGVTPGTYGNSANVAQITVEIDGHITAATNVPISGGGGSGVLRGQEFTTSGTFNVPNAVTSVWLTMIGGGGGGANRSVAAAGGGGGGSSGELIQNLSIAVTSLAAICRSTTEPLRT